MKRADLSPAVLDDIRRWRFDQILEKHEGPESWASILQYYEPDFMELDGEQVLLPLEPDHHPNISVLRAIRSDDGQVLMLFLKDTTYGSDIFDSGYLAVCQRFPGQDFFLAVVYHEWFIVENPSE